MLVMGDCCKMKLVVIGLTIDFAILLTNLILIDLIDLKANLLHL